MWRHIPTDSQFSLIFLYVVAGIFLGSLTWQVGETVYTNGQNDAEKASQGRAWAIY
ncbi:hypothetical protein FOTG_16382 [Fusarium oxysporum f. sp. vasinfectum 25433]|uniref:Uncharacterized protein n=1 Tax=Fusarium oxysporum f. sp. vasinfectum 25433 TaxID=1089449 RepID=X0KNQ8_FUSOX|nr:hypothetical protein FOTG_16382 [Fusarium oxysporum f. sp. vasinfectum 25433]